MSILKKYMVVEYFKVGKYGDVYKRLEEKGRMLQEGPFYIDSQVNKKKNKCFQLMENVKLFDERTSNWADLTDFEIMEIDAKKSSHYDLINASTLVFKSCQAEPIPI